MSFSPQEQAILQSIIVASDNDPRRPEFPPDQPRFPATPTYRIEVPGFSNVWLKDESLNPTGTHKDRMAWEIVVTYRYFLLARQSGQIREPLPVMSIISSGSAAVAIQTLLRRYGLPSLKVLVDATTDSLVIECLQHLGAQVYVVNLGNKPLHWQEILALTHNPHGFDITSNQAFDPTTRFYDWLSYEILNSSPEYCFIPFGTGNLYENVLNINKKELSSSGSDARFQGNIDVLRNCHFLGATTSNLHSKATKLYSPHLPFVHYDEQWIRFYQRAGFCGAQSNVYLLQEEFLDHAMSLAQQLNIQAEPSGLAGLALLMQMKDVIDSDKKILIVNTGKTKYPSGQC